MFEIGKHFGHEVVVAKYSDGDEPVGFAVECRDCFEVICDDYEGDE